MNNAEPIQLIAEAWLDAKQEVEAAQARLLEIEGALLEHMEVKPEGSKTTKAGPFTITTTGRMNRSLNNEVWEQVKAEIPPDFHPTELVEKLSDTKCKWLAEHAPEQWALAARAIVTKPGKTGVKIVQKEG